MGNPRRTNGTRRDKLRARVLREETHCHLCGGWVDKNLHYLKDGAPQIDELIPVAYGGSPYDRANTALAHRYCNRLRWHKPVEPTRAQLHANPPRFTTDGDRTATPLKPKTSRDWITQGA